MFRVMARTDSETCDVDAEGRRRAPVAHLIADGQDWRIYDYRCRAGPQDRPFEEQHESTMIAAVVAGSFSYRTDCGSALLYPGAFVLGNVGRCYECGHDHSSGDHCIAFHFSPGLFAEIAATVAGTSRFTFPAAMLPASRRLTAVAAETERFGSGASPHSADEVVMQLAETVVAAMSGTVETPARLSPRDERRIVGVLHHIETHATSPLELDALAGLACMSKYHFLRTFRRAVGMTPYQFLLSVRMRRAAARLAATSESVASIAFDSGFGDLSTFNHRFRQLFGMSPVAYRRRGGAA